MRALLIRLLGLRTFVVGAAVMVFATAASAIGTLTVYTTDLSNVPKDTFLVGETFRLKVTGDSQGTPIGSFDAIDGVLEWDGALTTTLSLTEGKWLNVGGGTTILCPEVVFCSSDGGVVAFRQTGSPVLHEVATSVIMLVADAVGSTEVNWGGTLLDFFGIYAYDAAGIHIPTGHSFTIVPEPDTLAL